MHKACKHFCLMIKQLYPDYFTNANIVDSGSLDLNGNNRYLFDKTCKYTGVDVGPGKNVDIVSPIHLADLPDGFFDVVISTNAMEHDMYVSDSVKRMYALLKPRGLMLLTAGGPGWAEHGTVNSKVNGSPLTCAISDEWAQYYKNIDAEFFNEMIDVEQSFESYLIGWANRTFMFYGIKKNK